MLGCTQTSNRFVESGYGNWTLLLAIGKAAFDNTISGAACMTCAIKLGFIM